MKKPVYLLLLVLLVVIVVFVLKQQTQNKLSHEQVFSVLQSASSPTQQSVIPSLGVSHVQEVDKSAEKIKILREIFNTKNDNDPRLDSEFKEISSELKQAMITEYQSTAPEKRNERGTVVFLLGRVMKSEADLPFMKTVLNEEPCQSLADCKKAEPPPTGEEEHLQSLSQTTLFYPQIMALRMLEASFNASADTRFKESIVNEIREASHSSISKISQEALAILSRIAPSSST